MIHFQIENLRRQWYPLFIKQVITKVTRNNSKSPLTSNTVWRGGFEGTFVHFCFYLSAWQHVHTPYAWEGEGVVKSQVYHVLLLVLYSQGAYILNRSIVQELSLWSKPSFSWIYLGFLWIQRTFFVWINWQNFCFRDQAIFRIKTASILIQIVFFKMYFFGFSDHPRLLVFTAKELSLCHKPWFSNPYIFVNQCMLTYIFESMNSVRYNDHSLKYQRFTPSGCKDTKIRKF